VPTSRRPQVNNTQYPGCLAGYISHEKVVNDVVAEVIMSRTVDDKAMTIC
jgi:uncharacterized protein YciU (UPF0263 family)